MLFNSRQLLNAKPPISVMDSGNSIDVMPELENASHPISVTDSGITTVLSCNALAKAFDQIFVIEPPSSTERKYEA